MHTKKFVPHCGNHQNKAGIKPSLWLEPQLVSDAARLRLISARRQRSSCCSAFAPPTGGPTSLHSSPQAFPQPSQAPKHSRPRGLSNAPKPQRRPSVHYPDAQRFVEELGVLGWRCKGSPPHSWPSDTLAVTRSILVDILPHLAKLPSGSLAHCCWALAQLGEAGGRDPYVISFVAAVQRQLLAPVQLSYGSLAKTAHAMGETDEEYKGSRPASEDPAAEGGFSSGNSGAVTVVRAAAAQGGPAPRADHACLASEPDVGDVLHRFGEAAQSRGGGHQAPAAAPLTHGMVALRGQGVATMPPPPPSRAAGGRQRSQLMEMDAKELSKLAWAVAKLGIRPDVVLPALDAAGAGSTAVMAAEDWQRLQLHWWHELGGAAAGAIERIRMPPQALCNTLWSFATCGQRHGQLLAAAAECIAGGHRTRYEPVGVANLFWAFATMGFYGDGARGGGSDLYDKLYDMLVRLALPLVEAMTMQNLSNVAWSLVTTRLYVRQPSARQLLAAICARATELVSAAAASAAAASAAVALPGEHVTPPLQLAASAGLYGDVMVGLAAEEDELGGRAVIQPPNGADIMRYDPHSASVLAWSLTQTAPPGHPRCVSYLDAVVTAATAMPPGLESYSDQDMAMLLMAHCRTRHYSAALVRAVRQEVLRRLVRGMEPHALMNICYCLATSNYYNDELYEAVAAAAARGLERFGPPLATRLVWSLARARHYNQQLLASFSSYIRPRLSECSSRDLVASVTALAQFHHYDQQLFTELAKQALARTTSSGAATALHPPQQQQREQQQQQQQQSQTLDVVAGKPGRGGAGTAARAAGGAGAGAFAGDGRVVSEPLPPRALVNLLWSFALLGHVDEQLLGALLERLRRVDIGSLGVPAVMQLCQAQVMLQDIYGGIIKVPKVLTPEQMEVARATWQRVSSAATTVSRLQQDVVACLRRLGAQPRCERVTPDGLFSIDTSLEWGGRRVAVEVDGPAHFTCSRPFRPLGRTLAKRRCLEIRGWRVLSVPGHEWRALGGDPATEERYLRAALDGVLWRTHVLEGLV